MSDLMTTADMADGKLDLTTLKVYINGDENVVNEPRLAPGFNVGSLAALNKHIKDKVDLQIATLPSGHKGYKTLAAAQAAQSTLAANTLIEVTNDSTAANNGVYLWDGASLVKSTFDTLSQAKAYADANAMFKPVGIATAIDFNNYKTYGYYAFANGTIWDNSNNKPPVSNQWAYLLVQPISATVVNQIVYCLNAQKIYMRYCNSSNVWSAWGVFSDDATLTAAINASIDNSMTQRVNNVTQPVYKAASKNLFDKDAVINNFYVSGSGTLDARTNAVTTNLVNITNATSVAISGLQSSTGYRAYRFLDANKALLSVSSIAPNATSKVTNPPIGAVYLQLTLKDTADTFTLDTSTIQIESSNTITAYTPFVKGDLIELYNKPLNASSLKSKAFGAKYLIFGDSITETCAVDSGSYETIVQTRWASFAKTTLEMSRYRNYAKSGASFKNRNLSSLYQYLGYQVETAITNNEIADVVIVACGTNDGTSNLGDYDTAMGKAIADLDKTLILEAARYAFYKIREKWGSAVCFYCTPLQRADAETTTLAPMLDGLAKMAKRYGFTIIDQHSNSGIVKDFEVNGTAGRYLQDGLHPNTTGQQVQANYIVSQIIERMTY